MILRARANGVIPESAILKACLQLLRYHPKVGCAWRANTGGLKDARGQYVKFGFRGQPDIMAVLKPSGVFLAIECKRLGKRPTAAQDAFLRAVIAAGGHALCVTDAAQLERYLRESV